MNDQVILSVTKRGGGLEVTTRGTGHDQLAAIEAVAASAWRVMTADGVDICTYCPDYNCRTRQPA